ncbi:MAG: tail fiber protein [Sphingomonas sp.]
MKTSKLLLSAMAGAAALALGAPAQAQDFYVGEVLMFGNGYCVRGSTEANGQLLSIAQNQALFSILGTTYGGNGVTTFALPDQRGRAAYSTGQAPGLSDYALGQPGGLEQTTVLISQLAAHTHDGTLMAAAVAPNINDPTNAVLADFPAGSPPIYNKSDPANVPMAPGSILTGFTGGSQPIGILSPYLVLRQCVMLQGIFPSRN